MIEIQGVRIHITGIVQGVGFRPFVFGLAGQLGLKGWVRNTSGGVDIEVDGSKAALDDFIHALKNKYPPLARIDTIQVDRCPPNGFTTFEIIHSEPIPGAYIPISPDVSICSECLREMFDPSDRRYLYPFINCTHCGPRFTIIEDIPYDRPKTTMARFEMCRDCLVEYQNPGDRRFHAQPVACPACGPHVWLEYSDQTRVASQHLEAIQEAIELLVSGKILAIKGLGGYHLACDATNPSAVAELRVRKLRVDKPYALMMPDIETVQVHCHLNSEERRLLCSQERPILLLKRKPQSNITPAVAPNQDTMGVMLPYSPLHYILFRPGQFVQDLGKPDGGLMLPPLVMTSGNLSEEPIAFSNQDARERLSTIADAFLMHNRDIRIRCDDSVIRVVPQSPITDGYSSSQPATPYYLRRSRGYAPNPVLLPWKGPQALASGAELKNTFCLTRDNYAFLSHHIGDMENYETLTSFQEGIEHFEKLFRVSPEIYACDLHPDYLATRYILNRAGSTGIPVFQAQHHHAHIAACMADNGLNSDHQVIGIAFDGTGYGSDGAIWGGEFLIASYGTYQRFGHLQYTPLPGGDSAIKKPYRAALAQLWHYQIPWDEDLPPVIATCGDELSMLHAMLQNQINAPPTSSIGRLFDAVAALIGVRSEVNYEAQAAIELEGLVDPAEDACYLFDIKEASANLAEPGLGDRSLILDALPLFTTIIAEFRANCSIPKIAAKFHNGLAQAIVDVCRAARKEHGIGEVALSGGVWQNMTLLRKTISELEAAGFRVHIHRQVPPNDGGLALGQASIAAHAYRNQL